MKKIFLLLNIFLIGFCTIAEAGRMYDPEIARFTTPDPALRDYTPNEQLKLINGGLYSNNPYNYALNNPVRYVDPDGRLPVLAPAIWGGIKLYAALKATLATATVGATAYTGYRVYEEYGDDISVMVNGLTEAGASILTANPYGDQTLDQLGKSLKSYEDLVNEHTQKLDDYIQNPDAHDNQGRLNNARNEQEREAIIRGRTEALEKQINKQKKEIEKIEQEIQRRSSQD